ncbi:MAG: DUF721 domain-containing protein [Actinomycetota bacterium]|nr:DUF721 domain-containing protein [Actinomycetota bacterium]MDQ3573346.1 DUF721 domain-containing protein [Actinomycetota bacterium]
MKGPSSSDQGAPRRVGVSLDHLTRTLGAPPAAVMEAVFSRWEDVVGPAIASHARPLSLQGGLLVVIVDEAAWGSELRYRARDLLARIAERVGPGAPDAMAVRVRPGGAEERPPQW